MSRSQQKTFKLTKEEAEALYKIVKKYEENAPESDEEFYDDYYDSYEEPIKKKVIKSILFQISSNLSNDQKEEIDKDFLRKKYHTFNNDVDEKVYSIIEKAFDQLKTIEITYFNMESAEFSKRKLDVYYKSRRYVIGYCHLRKEIRKFRTSRIASAKLTGDNYKIPKNFDKNEY
jgi:predicted DNA-binding transcriptional regulator YafY